MKRLRVFYGRKLSNSQINVSLQIPQMESSNVFWNAWSVTGRLLDATGKTFHGQQVWEPWRTFDFSKPQQTLRTWRNRLRAEAGEKWATTRFFLWTMILLTPVELLLLLGHTDGTSTTACGLSVLTTHTQTRRERQNRDFKLWFTIKPKTALKEPPTHQRRSFLQQEKCGICGSLWGPLIYRGPNRACSEIIF